MEGGSKGGDGKNVEERKGGREGGERGREQKREGG